MPELLAPCPISEQDDSDLAQGMSRSGLLAGASDKMRPGHSGLVAVVLLACASLAASIPVSSDFQVRSSSK